MPDPTNQDRDCETLQYPTIRGDDPDDIGLVLEKDQIRRDLQSKLLQVGACIDFVERRSKALAESLAIPAADAARIVTSLLLGEHF